VTTTIVYDGELIEKLKEFDPDMEVELLYESVARATIREVKVIDGVVCLCDEEGLSGR
jgi:hypothetical protein